jgi:hypothetical protein
MWLAGGVVVCFGLFLLGLAAAIVVAPQVAKRFLGAFAGSARAHYTEQALRLLVGGALIARSPMMWQPGLFRIFGWLVVISTIGLLLTPWRRHQQFAQAVMPPLFRRMWLFAVGAAALGAVVLYAVFRPVVR